MKINYSLPDKVFQITVSVILGVIVLAMLYPLYFTVIASFSNPHQVARGNVIFLPKDFSLDAYKNIFINAHILIGYRNTIFYTFFGTIWNLLLLIPCGYAMTKQGLKGRGIIMGIFIFTMYFGGGMVPYYFLIKNLGLINNPLVMIIPSGVSVYNIIIVRTAIMGSISSELIDSAKIDGAGEFRIFLQIVLPLSKAIIAVMALFHGVGHWNSFFNALMFISNPNLYPLQLVLRQILILNQSLVINYEALTDVEALEAAIRRQNMAEAMKYSLIFVASVPVLAAYPFVQKFFVKGVMIGSLKG